MKRRDFLKLSGCFIAAASMASLPGCGDDGGAKTGVFTFAEGVASGDPRASSVMLWTRVQAVSEDDADIALTCQVSESENFSTVVVEREIVATSASDHTVRVLVTDLLPGTVYYYRFVAGGDTIVGRTWTAPADDDETPVRLAWVSCQDFSAGVFGAYRQMINDDLEASEDEKIRLVVHLGDFIYETIGGQFQVALGDEMQAIELKNADGSQRIIEPFPSGGGEKAGATFAQTLEDYRHLYKQYLRDPHLRAARARWPFVQTWDDHEFTDDCWQSQANYDSSNSTDEPSQTRKVAANQAWFEFIPANLSDAEGAPGVANEAADFSAAAVEDVAFTDRSESNNADALASLTIYRSLRYGKNVDFILTDERSYRSDHTVPEETSFGSPIFFHPRTALPAELVSVMDAGSTANGGNPPDEILGFTNARKDSAPGTMLGAEQKAWWKSTMQASTATWKIWCNEVPMMRFGVKVGPAGILIYDRVAFCDAWDDKPGERNELMGFLRDEAIGNVVVISGDMHAHFAGTLMDDYDSDAPVPVATEFLAAGISSNSVFSFFEYFVRAPQPKSLRDLITFDATEFGGDNKFENNLNALLRFGTGSAQTAASTGDPAAVLAAADPETNPHLAFADCDAQGYGLMSVTSAGVQATLVTINRPVADMGEAGQGIKGTASFELAVDNPGGLVGPTLSGRKPFPLT